MRMNGGALVPLDKRTSFSFAWLIHKLKLLLQVLKKYADRDPSQLSKPCDPPAKITMCFS